jgi:hypothetical protein
VKTPSKWQTRQPIYRTSVAWGRRYEPLQQKGISRQELITKACAVSHWQSRSAVSAVRQRQEVRPDSAVWAKRGRRSSRKWEGIVRAFWGARGSLEALVAGDELNCWQNLRAFSPDSDERARIQA